MCPLSMSGNSLKSCRGTRCAVFSYYQQNVKKIGDEVYDDHLYICGLLPQELMKGSLKSQYPMFFKDLGDTLAHYDSKRDEVLKKKNDIKTT